jgi:alpha/beta superfamily hydrolase
VPRITTGSFDGPAGALEYVLNEPETTAAITRAAVLCHPHPLHGGTMHTRLLFHAARALQEMGVPVLRFNFRGVGKSVGQHDNGRGEVDDLRSALGFMQSSYPLPMVLGGFSFGSVVALRYLTHDDAPAVQRLLALGIPASTAALPGPLRWHGPKLFISGGEDPFGHQPDIERYFATLNEPKRLICLEGADHFLTGHMDEFRALIQNNLDLV